MENTFKDYQDTSRVSLRMLGKQQSYKDPEASDQDEFGMLVNGTSKSKSSTLPKGAGKSQKSKTKEEQLLASVPKSAARKRSTDVREPRTAVKGPKEISSQAAKPAKRKPSSASDTAEEPTPRKRSKATILSKVQAVTSTEGGADTDGAVIGNDNEVYAGDAEEAAPNEKKTCAILDGDAADEDTETSDEASEGTPTPSYSLADLGIEEIVKPPPVQERPPRDRALHACDQCHKSKVKCDARNETGDTPCGECEKKGKECTFAREALEGKGGLPSIERVIDDASAADVADTIHEAAAEFSDSSSLSPAPSSPVMPPFMVPPTPVLPLLATNLDQDQMEPNAATADPDPAVHPETPRVGLDDPVTTAEAPDTDASNHSLTALIAASLNETPVNENYTSDNPEEATVAAAAAAATTAQLPTPPSSVQRSVPSEMLYSKGRPERLRKKPDRLHQGVTDDSHFGAIDGVPTSDSVEADSEEDYSRSDKEVRDRSKQKMSRSRASEDAADPPPTPAAAGTNKNKTPRKRKASTTEDSLLTDRKPSKVAKNTPASSKPKATPVPRVPKISNKKPSARSKSAKPSNAESLTAHKRQNKAEATPEARVVKLRISRTHLVDKDLLNLSRKLTAREPLDSKPLPQGTPPVWAESRQALCETLSYFKNSQGGCYQNDGHVYGFLFDNVGHCREYVDENVIICRAGGSMEADSKGKMVQKKDQVLKDAQVQAIYNDVAHRNPLVVICGNRNIGAPCKMPHQYCVLSWFKPTDVWCEKTAGKGSKEYITVKYRLERLNKQEEAWHAPAAPELRVSGKIKDIGAIPPPVSQTCEQCEVEWPQIYLQGWWCYNPDCTRFWKIGDEDAPTGKEGLDYHPAFLLHEYAQWRGEGETEEAEPTTLRPPVPDVGNIIGDNLAYINTRGICCPKCGRCNSRRLFTGWVCENPTCDFTLFPEHRLVVPAMLHTPWDNAPTLVRNTCEPFIDLKVEHKFGFKISRYTFKGLGIDGCFIHAAADKRITQGVGGPDQIFNEMQSVDMGLQRRVFAVKKKAAGQVSEKRAPFVDKPPALPTPPRELDALAEDQSKENSIAAHPTAPLAVPTETSADEATQSLEDAEGDDEPAKKDKIEFEDGDLMTAFSINYGMPYKFVASGASRPFENSPEAVKECRRRLNWAQKEFLKQPQGDMDFNELLIFAYLEGQKIEYHDDGESGLGPRIATLSLGGRAKMHMRMKTKHHVGCSKTGIFTEERPIRGGLDGEKMYEKRLRAWEELQEIKGDSAAYNKRRKEIPEELGIYAKKGKLAKDLLTVTLNHGDIIIMDGYDVQKFLEHKVVPEGRLRFALTCRTVLEDHLKPEEKPNYEVIVDPVTYSGPGLA